MNAYDWVRTLLGGATYAFAGCFDTSFSLRYDISKIIRKFLPITMRTDSESLFKILVKPTTTAERNRRSVIEIRAAREVLERKEISCVEWIRSKYNNGDRLTKLSKCKALDGLIQNGKLDDLPIE